MRRLAALAILAVSTACSATAQSVMPQQALASRPPAEASAEPAHERRGPERVARGRELARPDQPPLAADIVPILVEDHCVDRDLATPVTAEGVLTILDRSYGLPPTYVPSDLVAASTAGLDGTSGAKLVRSLLIDDLADMAAAWTAAGLEMEVESAYRSYADQAATFDSWVARLGLDAASMRTARPGHSEHQLGTALDLTSPGWSGRFGDWAAETAEGRWMAEHGWEYGFVMSYPAGSEAATCFGYEPWHYRWIGREAAAEQRASGLALREYLEGHAGD